MKFSFRFTISIYILFLSEFFSRSKSFLYYRNYSRTTNFLTYDTNITVHICSTSNVSKSDVRAHTLPEVCPRKPIPENRTVIRRPTVVTLIVYGLHREQPLGVFMLHNTTAGFTRYGLAQYYQMNKEGLFNYFYFWYILWKFQQNVYLQI